MNIGFILKKLREKNNLSQQDVADFLGITRQAYTNYELGKREPDIKCIRRLCEFFHVSADYLIFGATSENNSNVTVSNDLQKPTPKHSVLLSDIEKLSSQSIKDLKRYIELLKLRDDKKNKQTD